MISTMCIYFLLFQILEEQALGDRAAAGLPVQYKHIAAQVWPTNGEDAYK